MMKIIIPLILLAFLCSCGTPGAIHVAKDESESFKTAYEDARLKKLSNDNDPLLRDIYKRLRRSNIDIFKEGIGITLLNDQNNEKLHYFMVNIRPSEIVFDEKDTTPDQRFSHVLMNYYPKYLKFIKKEDLERDDIEGLALGVYWPVRDFSQCNTYGGFIEYIHIYFPKEDIWDMNDGRKSFVDVVQDAEIITSLDLKPAKNVRPVF
jgi:hypothetical protein